MCYLLLLIDTQIDPVKQKIETNRNATLHLLPAGLVLDLEALDCGIIVTSSPSSPILTSSRLGVQHLLRKPLDIRAIDSPASSGTSPNVGTKWVWPCPSLRELLDDLNTVAFRHYGCLSRRALRSWHPRYILPASNVRFGRRRGVIM